MNKIHPILIYSAFGTGKSSLLEQLLRFQLTEERLTNPLAKARLVTAEHYNVLQPAIDEGLLEVWKVNTRNYPFQTLRFAADGYWPEDTNDPESPLIPPTTETWQNFPVRMFEGLATLAQYLSGAYVVGGLTQRAETERIGFEKDYIQFMDGETSVSGLTWTHFNMTQKEMVECVQRSQKRPGLVLWTTHEDITKSKRQMGPEVIGSAVTGAIGREFADVWHLVAVPQDVTDPVTGELRRFVERRLYVKEHYAPNCPLPFQAKHSAGVRRDPQIPDYFAMTRDGLPLYDTVERVWKRLYGPTE